MNKDELEKRFKNGTEYRNVSVLEIKECQEDDDKKKDECIVEGYATTFNEPYKLYSDDEFEVDEVVDSRAFDECDLGDCIFQYDHQGKVFARSRNNTLELNCDQHGLKVRANLGGTDAGRELYQEIKGGYIDRMSFGFIVAEDEIKQENQVSGFIKVTRTIKKISRLFDVSAVSIPANDYTQISARSYSDRTIANIKADAEMRRKREEIKASLIKKIKE